MRKASPEFQSELRKCLEVENGITIPPGKKRIVKYRNVKKGIIEVKLLTLYTILIYKFGI